MSERWFYQLLAEEFGPVDSGTVVKLHRDGTLSDDDLVRRHEDRQWQPLSQTSLLSDQEPADSEAAAELQDLDELQFEFEENAASQPATQRQSDPEAPQDLADLSELSFSFEERDERPLRRSPSAQRGPVHSQDAETDDEPGYWYQTLGEELGPVTLDELIRIAEAGNVSEDDLVRCGRDGNWVPASTFDELGAAILSSRFDDDPSEQQEWMSAATSRRLGIDPSAPRVPTAEAKSETPGTADADSAPVPESKQSPAPVSESPSPAAPRPGRRKKRRKASEDDVIDEIFDEVFTADEEPETSTARRSHAATSQTAPAAESAPPPPAPAPAPVPMPSYPTDSTASAAAIASKYAASVSTTSSSSGGSSFEISGGLVAGVLAVLLIAGVGTAFGMGWIAMPSIGSHSPADIRQQLQQQFSAYQSVIGSEPTEAAWKDHCDQNRPVVSELAEDARDATGEAGRALQVALGDLVAILGSSLDDSERRGRLEKSFEDNIAKATF